MSYLDPFKILASKLKLLMLHSDEYLHSNV
jgi:hypothetical protein